MVLVQERRYMEKLLVLLLLLLVNPELLQVNLLPDNYWQNETIFVQEDDNATATNSNGFTIISDGNEIKSIFIPVDPIMKVAFYALMLHILIVGGAIVIYSVIYCKTYTIKRRLLKETSKIKCRLQSPPTLKHLPNNENCSCHSCRVARQIISGLIVQQIITER